IVFFSEMEELGECECLHGEHPTVWFNFNAIVVFLPFMSVCGIIFNIINFVVYSRRRSSGSAYLAALGCSDIGVCLCGIFVIWADSARGYNFDFDQYYVFILPYAIPFGNFFQMLSVYITVLAAIDCFLTVIRLKGLLTPRSIKVLIIAIVAYNVITLWELEAVHCINPAHNKTMYNLCPTNLRMNDLYVQYYKGMMYTTFMAFLPFILLSVLTILILILLKRMRPAPLINSVDTVIFISLKRRHKKVHFPLLHRTVPFPLLSRTHTGTITVPFPLPDCCPAQEEVGSPVALLLVIVLFLICNITSLMVNIFEMIQIEIDDFIIDILVDVGNLLVVFNATANFIIYYCSDPDFRNEIPRLCANWGSMDTAKKRGRSLRDHPYKNGDLSASAAAPILI
ncbi:frpr-2, partial [Pristionchus pacificus]|uniref:Frpr-2 n=1 Tax=Pristionchus pacificus TaxID=54126 RepID=A0A2A6BXL1_PRIPA